MGGHLVGAMPYRGLLSHYLAPRAQAGPGGDMTTCVGVTLTGILRTMSLPKKKINNISGARLGGNIILVRGQGPPGNDH